jgi:hypothetical protein
MLSCCTGQSTWISQTSVLLNLSSATINGLTISDNAYVSGLKEDLGFYGNELVHLQTLYTAGAVVGQIPFMFLLTHLPMHYAVPFLDIAWGVVTLLQYRANSYAEMAAYRFLVGWFEVHIMVNCILVPD